MSDIAIEVRELGKEYKIGGPQQQFDTFGEQLVSTVKAPFRRAKKLLGGQATGAAELDQSLWALRDLSFDIKRGEAVGIIGRNGAGKSTLLKVLSRITEPTEGRARIYGRVGSLLEVGTGFHPELTGRENIFLNGAILGMSRDEIENRFDEIVAFAEIEKFIDTPVKHYSSGMYVRLAFSVAAHLEPEVLLVDEVLAVGDISFQKKCLGKMDDVADEGRTVLFVSHNMSLIQTLCQRGIYLENGRVATDGTVTEAVNSYLESLEQMESLSLAERTDREGKGLTRVVEVEIWGKNNSPVLTTGGPARFIFHLDKLLPGMTFTFIFFNHLGQRVAIFRSELPGPEDEVRQGIGPKFVCEMDELLLLPGRYYLNVLVWGKGEWQDFIESAATFDVQPGTLNGRAIKSDKNFSVAMPHRWQVPPTR